MSTDTDQPTLAVTTTGRGFAVARGVDLYGQPWSIQDSSLATQAAIWLGGDGSDGARAHLTQSQAAELLPLLRQFVDTGTIARTNSEPRPAGDLREALAGGQPISTAPYACHVLAGRFDEADGEWYFSVVASPPIRPFTHWWPLPDLAATHSPAPMAGDVLAWLADCDNLIVAASTTSDTWQVRRASGIIRGEGPTPLAALRAAMLAAHPSTQEG